jgi:hypothetical protein
MIKGIFALGFALTGAWVILLGWLIVSGVGSLVGSESANQPDQAIYEREAHKSRDL